jgi:hypothetical protein
MNGTSVNTMSLPRTPRGGHVTQLKVALSEWTKFRSIRSTLYALLTTVVVTVGLGLIAAFATVSQWDAMLAASKATFNPLPMSLLGVNFGVLAIAVLGILMITNEFATGMIRSTFAAVPDRLPVLWAKAGVYSIVALAVTVPATLASFLGGQAILSAKHLQTDFGHAGVARVVLGSALYLTIAGLLGLGLGGIFRSTAAAVATFAGILFVLPGRVSVLPAGISNLMSPYLPSNAGQAIMNVVPPAHALAPWVGLGVFAGYALASIAAAAFLLVRRDA